MRYPTLDFNETKIPNKCKKCFSPSTVRRMIELKGSIKRTRQCDNAQCKFIWSTYEIALGDELLTLILKVPVIVRILRRLQKQLHIRIDKVFKSIDGLNDESFKELENL